MKLCRNYFNSTNDNITEDLKLAKCRRGNVHRKITAEFRMSKQTSTGFDYFFGSIIIGLVKKGTFVDFISMFE